MAALCRSLLRGKGNWRFGIRFRTYG